MKGGRVVIPAHSFPFEGGGLPAESEGGLRKQNPNTCLTPTNKQVRVGLLTRGVYTKLIFLIKPLEKL